MTRQKHNEKSAESVLKNFSFTPNFLCETTSFPIIRVSIRFFNKPKTGITHNACATHGFFLNNCK